MSEIYLPIRLAIKRGTKHDVRAIVALVGEAGVPEGYVVLEKMQGFPRGDSNFSLQDLGFKS